MEDKGFDFFFWWMGKGKVMALMHWVYMKWRGVKALMFQYEACIASKYKLIVVRHGIQPPRRFGKWT